MWKCQYTGYTSLTNTKRGGQKMLLTCVARSCAVWMYFSITSFISMLVSVDSLVLLRIRTRKRRCNSVEKVDNNNQVRRTWKVSEHLIFLSVGHLHYKMLVAVFLSQWRKMSSFSLCSLPCIKTVSFHCPIILSVCVIGMIVVLSWLLFWRRIFEIEEGPAM